MNRQKLAHRKLEDLRKEYQYWLYDDFLPFLDRFVVDHKVGGFMCETDRDGRNISGRKRTWFEGRGIWIYSFLFNELDPKPEYLEIARKSVEFILRHDPAGPDLMPHGYRRNGSPLNAAPDIAGYGDLFVATGLQ
jgi:mannose/cellobiose epimerase-like protein (N-acyl-D-glucosamine 2-epimerase family)